MKRKTNPQEDLLLSIINNFTDGLLIFDRRERLFLINPKGEEFLAVKKKDLIGKSLVELSKIKPFKPLINFLKKETQGIFKKEISFKKLILEVNKVPIIKKEEKLGILITLHDITREKVVEKMKTEFVSLAAHQLRTPLSAIKWTLKMLLDGDLGEINSEQREFIQKTYLSNERMIALINNLLDVTRIEEGRYLYKTTPSDIEALVRLVIKSQQEEIQRKGLKFVFDKPSQKLPPIKIDVEKMRLAIQNLINNAIRYTSFGGEVTVSLKYVKKEIEFSVKDTGAGIPKDQQKRVFSKFFRGTNVLRLETEGTGLGLYITKNIIEAHGGKIWFESEEGRGTTFYFSLPISKT